MRTGINPGEWSVDFPKYMVIYFAKKSNDFSCLREKIMLKSFQKFIRERIEDSAHVKIWAVSETIKEGESCACMYSKFSHEFY